MFDSGQKFEKNMPVRANKQKGPGSLREREHLTLCQDGPVPPKTHLRRRTAEDRLWRRNPFVSFGAS